MPTYTVTVSVDACVNVDVEADDEAQAKEKAMETVGRPHLCHQCARELQLGDPMEAIEAVEKDA